MNNFDFQVLEDFLTSESFRKFVLNEPGEHVSRWEHWIEENPDKSELVEQARLIVEGTPFSFNAANVDSFEVNFELERLKSKMSTNVGSLKTVEQPAKRKVYQMMNRKFAVAASIILLVVCGFLLQNYALNPIITHQTSYGEQLAIVLPDSTTVMLNANSLLTYRKQKPRKVTLSGEAFFNVKKKELTNANFLVITDDLAVEVLGTAFNVNERNYKTEVVLEEGSVKLNLKRDFEQEVFMKPGDLVAFSAKTSKKLDKQVVKPTSVTSWKDGVLQFEDIELSEVMKRIEDIYGWRAVYQDKELQTRKVSIPLPTNDLTSVLTLLNQAIGVEIERIPDDNVLLLH